MREALSPPPGQHTARAIEDVCIDYQQLITTHAARWLQNNKEHFSVSKPHRPSSYPNRRQAHPIVIFIYLLVSTLVPKLPTRFWR
jgi:hypothetical protein